jgi:hypothetical protein
MEVKVHQDEGNYSGKHPEGTILNEAVASEIKKRVVNERVSCKSAHEAAAEAGVSPRVIGESLDLLELRINGCQLGLFGHNTDRGKADLSLPGNMEGLKNAVLKRCSNNGISCSELWAAAEEEGCGRITAAAVCEAAGIKIHSCQLGAF